MKNSKRGFTLIELLIVIALLGALAVALLAALDPLEQIKKGNDTGTRNTISEIGESFTRYASVKQGIMPFGTITWQAVGTDGTTAAATAIQSVIDAGELKTDFFTLAKGQLKDIYITAIDNTSTQKAYVCFKPTSKSFRVDPNTKFATVNGTDGTMQEVNGCDQGGTNASGVDCYWCVQ